MSAPAPAPATDLDRSRKLLEEMGFEFAPQALAELAERAVREKLPQLGLLDLILATERERREASIMSNGFQFFEGSMSINSTTPQVTVHRSGRVVLTQAAVDLLGEGVDQVQVGYNAKTGAVGIRPVSDGGRGALRLRKQPNGRSRLLDAKRFFAHHGLAVGAVRRLPVEDFGGGIIGLLVNGEEEPTEPKAAAKAPKGRKSAG